MVLVVGPAAARARGPRCCPASRPSLFAIGATRGVQHTPHAWLFRHARAAAARRPPDELEDPAPPRFAQGVGLGFALVALVGFARRRSTLLGQVAIGFALVAALLNAVFGFCLGCEMYLLIKPVVDERAAPLTTDTRPPPQPEHREKEPT